MKILNGHNSFETAYKVDDYPYGFKLRTSIYYWIETTKKRGDRFCSCTINPKNGKLNAPKKSTYSPFLYMFIDDKTDYVEQGSIDSYDRDKFADKLKFIIEVVEEATDNQVFNLRQEWYGHMKASYPWIVVKYNDERKPYFTEWMKATLKHIATCEFHELCNFPPPPEQDQPEEEVKFTLTTYTTN